MEENHKGQKCEYASNLTCQEGYCSDCQIYLDALDSDSWLDEQLLDIPEPDER